MSLRQHPDGGQESLQALKQLIPLWLQTSSKLLRSGAVAKREQNDLRYAVHLFREWSAEPEVLPSPMQIDHVYRGPGACDWLVVSFMAKAVPGHNMLNWIEAPMSMLGFPSLQIAATCKPAPDLIAWNYEGKSEAYIAKLGLDEMHGFTGLAKFSGNIARVHAVMLRQMNFAWMFFLSMHSPAGNGNELQNLRDDDRRAGAIFGSVRLMITK
jgi:hypothetical protein